MVARHWKFFSLLVAVGLLLPLGACGGGESVREEVAIAPVSVHVHQVERRTPDAGWALTGTIRARTVAPVAAKVMAAVLEVAVEEGSRVRAGDLLVRLDDKDAQARLAQAEAARSEAEAALEEVAKAIEVARSAREAAAAQAALAEATYRRFQQLLERKSVSRQEFDEVEAKLKAAQAQLRQAEEGVAAAEAKQAQVQAKIAQAEAAVEQARVYLRDCTVRAPFAGIVSEKRVDVGQLAVPGQPLLILEDPTEHEAWVAVPEGRIAEVRLDMAVQVAVAALGGDTLAGTVREIIPRADPATRTTSVKVALPSHPGLRSGQFAEVRFPGAEEAVIAVPEDAVLRRGQLLQVFVVGDDGVAQLRLVQLGRRWSGWVEVLAGLAVGDRVVLEPPADLRDGTPVRVVAGAAQAGDGGANLVAVKAR
ncbi:MAG: efflux RND transporter periplasmic adaptor subunit [Acidobacteriota bacterium]